MGEVELDQAGQELIIYSIFYFYGDACSKELSDQIGRDIAAHWNEPHAKIQIGKRNYNIEFRIESHYEPALDPKTVWYNTDPRCNFFRIEEFSISHISFVDGIGCNTGFFKLDNLLNNSTTAAHEYGHSLGLDHPKNLDIRGAGQPGIMYPRGTICDPLFQYDPAALPLQPGGTLNPYLRKVLPNDIEQLRLHRLRFNRSQRAVLGEFTNLFHQKHQLDSA